MAKKQPNPQLRRLHAKGKHLLAASTRTMASMKAKTRTQKNRLMEARKFARLYDDDDLERICSLGQSIGRPLTRVDVLQLIRVPDRRKRNALAKTCSVEKWTVRKLEMEVRLITPRRKPGGRRQTPPRSVEEALLVTERTAASWVRWVSVLKPEKDGKSKKGTLLSDLPTSIRTKVTEIERVAEKLQEDIELELEIRTGQNSKSASGRPVNQRRGRRKSK